MKTFKNAVTAIAITTGMATSAFADSSQYYPVVSIITNEYVDSNGDLRGQFHMSPLNKGYATITECRERQNEYEMQIKSDLQRLGYDLASSQSRSGCSKDAVSFTETYKTFNSLVATQQQNVTVRRKRIILHSPESMLIQPR